MAASRIGLARFPGHRPIGVILGLIGMVTGLQMATRAAPRTSGSVLRTIIVGFTGGLIRHTDRVHGEVAFAEKLRAENGPAVHVEVFENLHRSRALAAILRLLDTDHDGELSAEEKRAARIIIYGHSWGGAAGVDLARDLDKQGIPVLLTIQVDSVAKVGQNDAVIPSNVKQAANFFQPHGLIHGRKEIRAADPAKTRIVGNFRFDYKENPVACKGYPWYQRVWSPSHIEIECDPHVWSEAEKLIRKTLETPAEN